MAGLAVVAVAPVLYLGVSAYTPPLTDAHGNEIPNSSTVLEKIELGALDQWIRIRGTDRSNPVLLSLHGGARWAQMAFAHHLDGELEKHFVIVHWDQRGAGKSNHRGFDEETMRLERYLQDARELIEYLRRRLGQDRIILLGHSWGTRLGMELVKAHPEYFDAYIGVSQVVNHDRATELARDWLREAIDPMNREPIGARFKKSRFPRAGTANIAGSTSSPTPTAAAWTCPPSNWRGSPRAPPSTPSWTTCACCKG